LRRCRTVDGRLLPYSCVPFIEDRPDSDLTVYLVSGIFAVLVYLAALAVLDLATDVALTLRTTATLSGGFLLFMGSYVVAMVVYRQVRSREDGA